MNKVFKVLQFDHWATANDETPDGPFVLRWRTPILRLPDTVEYPHRLRVVWPYAPEETGAMPDSSTSDQMHVFEDRLCEAWEHDGNAFLAAVLTFDGARQWLFYTKSVNECGNRIVAMPQERDPYPIEMDTDQDPDWAYLREKILASINWEKHQPDWLAAFDSA